MRLESAQLMAAVFILGAALTFAQEDAGYAKPPKPPVSMLPPAPFVTTASAPKTTPSHPNVTTAPPTPPKTTTANVTTAPPTPPKTTTANVTTVPPTPPKTTTANVTTAPPTPPKTTTANVTTAPPTPHNTTTANVTTAPPTPPKTTTANVTAAPPTPKPEPTAPTNLTVGTYTVKAGNKLCIKVQAAIQIHVKQVAGTYIVPGSAEGAGKCEGNSANLKITFKEGDISMNFIKNDTTKVVSVNAVTVNLAYAFKPGVVSHLALKNDSLQLFSMATGHSYSCKSESVFMGNSTFLEFSQDRMQAFNFTNDEFGPSDLCKADQPDYRVAIGVGVVLLILIVIVVVAYLISRRRRTDGYQTL